MILADLWVPDARVAVPEPRPGQVTDEAFLAEEFFDARDAVEVKYEMVRRVRVDGAPVTAIAAAFGTPGRRPTRQPPPWPPPGWTAWCRPGPGPAAATSSPGRSWPGPRSGWRPIRR
jgi:hypothetical protein